MDTAQIDVWIWSLSAENAIVERLRNHLSGSERSRAARFLEPRHRSEYSVAWGRLREILGQRVQLDPDEVNFELGEFGKPKLSSSTTNKIQFSLSHTNRSAPPLAALAISHEFDLGIDIEAHRQLDLSIARTLPALEQMQIADAEQAGRDPVDIFLRIWTCKEAALKACGLGLTDGLDAVTIDLRSPETTAKWSSPRREAPGRFSFACPAIGDGLYCAIAALNAPAPLQCSVNKDDLSLLEGQVAPN